MALNFSDNVSLAMNRPPYFDGSNYLMWKKRMMFFIKSYDIEVWKVIALGPKVARNTNGEIKREEEFSDEDWKGEQFNSKAMQILYCALNPEDLNRVASCDNAKEVWKMSFEIALRIQDFTIRSTLNHCSYARSSLFGSVTVPLMEPNFILAPRAVSIAIFYWLHWTKFYQKPQGRKSIKGKKELMLRPCFPPIYRESQLPNASTISGVAVVVKDVWCVGDLVDWRYDDCYWSGRINQVFGNEKYEIELLPHPFGESATYEGSSDQLRPSLQWSLHEDWTLSTPPPVPGWSGCRSPAQLIYPTKQERSPMTAHTVDNRMNEVEEKTDTVSQPNILLLSSSSSGSLPPSNGFSQMGKGLLASKETKAAEKAGNMDVKDGGVSRPNFLAGISSLQARNASMKLAQDSSENGSRYDSGPSKKSGNGGSIPLNPMSNPADAAISLPPPSGPLNVSSKESKKPKADVNVRGKNPSSMSTPMAVKISESSGHPDAGPLKKMKTAGNFSLNFTNSNTIEAAIVDLEELVNKVKWMKGILQFGLPNSPPSWKFIEHRESSMPKQKS